VAFGNALNQEDPQDPQDPLNLAEDALAFFGFNPSNIREGVIMYLRLFFFLFFLKFEMLVNKGPLIATKLSTPLILSQTSVKRYALDGKSPEVQKPRSLEAQKFRSPEVQKSRNLEVQKSRSSESSSINKSACHSFNKQKSEILML
jgi:hypothetical protein